MLSDDRLRGDEHEGMLDEPLDVVAGFMLRPFERVGSEVEKRWQAQLDHWLRPDVEPMSLLFQEDGLPLVIAQPGQVAVVGPVEEFAALIGTLAGEKIALVVAIEVDFEVLPGSIVARQ